MTRFRKNSRALEYIAKFHYGDKDKNNKGYMMFKAGTHIIAIGKNIPRVQDTYRIKATEEDLYMLLDLVNKKSVLEYGETLFEYKQKNKFIDKNTGEEISFTGKQLFY